MKKKSLFEIIGCGLLIGAVILCVMKFFNKHTVNKRNEGIYKKDIMDITTEYITEDNLDDLDVVKMRSANSIYDRHKTAAQVAKVSMGKINENADLPSKLKEEFDSMFEELDKLSE